MEYKKSLQALAPHTEFLMTLYLHPDITVEEVRKAHEAGVSGEFPSRRI
jgi:dihydroorotase